MDVEQMKKLLEGVGVNPEGRWGKVGAKKGVTPRVAGEQAEALRKIESILEGQLKSDMEEVARMHSTLQRLKHGGGI
jgi:hypothetical protein